MTQKKISGYTIFMDKLLGKGSYGSVIYIWLDSGLQRIKGHELTASGCQDNLKEEQ